MSIQIDWYTGEEDWYNEDNYSTMQEALVGAAYEFANALRRLPNESHTLRVTNGVATVYLTNTPGDLP